jgi:N-methylhydantoinase B/oxoprolinase/acetone carboxylase alpha subunit
VKRILNKSVTPKEVILARKQVSAHRKDIKKVEELFDEMGSNHLANILDKVNQTKKTSPTEAVTV